MATTLYHPAEIAYALSYTGATLVAGWGAEPFTPPRGKAEAFYADGLSRLKRNGRVLPGQQEGRFRFADELSRLATALADPQIVLVTHRQDGGGARVLTHHLSGTNIIELARGPDGNFSVTEHATLAGAAGAAAAFVGATDIRPVSAVRLEANQKIFSKMRQLAGTSTASVVAGLKKLGADEVAARSAAEALAKPTAAGVVTVMYCAANVVQDSEPYAVATTAAGESWVIFPPATSTGPVVLERTSVSALAARVLVAISARLVMPG